MRHARPSAVQLVLSLLATSICSVVAVPAELAFVDCSSSPTPNADSTPARSINITSVYGQIADYGEGPVIKYDVFGESDADIHGATSTLLATLFKTSSILSFSINGTGTSSAFCEVLRAPTSVVAQPDVENCTIPAGPLAFSAYTPLHHNYNLMTIDTRLRALDASSPPLELACIDVYATPVEAKGKGGYYGVAEVLFWASVGLAIGYWIVIGVGRIAAAWDRVGSPRHPGWFQVKWAGTVLSSAISGERLSSSPALLRFATPTMRDIIFHTQWCAGLAMVAVQWPAFAYPILRNAAWANLIYNVTFIQGSDGQSDHWQATEVLNYTPPSQFSDQLSNPQSPLFLDTNVANTFLLFPDGTKPGMKWFAYAVGIRPQDLFGTCLGIYFCIVAAAIVISLAIWFLDWLISSAFSGRNYNIRDRAARSPRSPRYSAHSETAVSKEGPDSPHMDDTPLPSAISAPRFTFKSRKAWWNYRLGQSSFHRNILYGNLVRILAIFHVPITIFSIYQFSLGRAEASLASLILAGFALAFLSIILPAFLLSRVAVTSTGKLYEATRTLLNYGPLYYLYSPGQQSFAYLHFAHNIVLGVAIGAGQKSGTAQAIIMLIVEVFAALATSMWLPWGEGANMGLISFMFCVGRIVTCVLLVILSPTVNVGFSAAGWLTVTILFVNGLMYLAFALMLVSKILECIIRLSGHLPFDRSRHTMDTGLLGAIGMLSCCRRKRRRPRHHRARSSQGPSTVRSEAQSRRQSKMSEQMFKSPNGPYQIGQLGASTSSSVPSYLRPEQASTPYREEGDDPDGGYILGAFHDDYMPPSEQQLPSPQRNANTGFTRVKGGRANFENPFSIQAGDPRQESPKRQFVPSQPQYQPPQQYQQQQPPPTTYPPSSYNQVAPSVFSNGSYTTASGSTASGYPLQAHSRKKSETAIIEDAAALAALRADHASQKGRTPPSPTAYRGESPLPPPAVPAFHTDDDYSTDSSVKPKRKFWFGKSASTPAEGDDSDGGHESDDNEGSRSRWPFGRRTRNRSQPEPVPLSPPADEAPSRSFQVVRRPQPQSRPNQPRASESATAPTTWRRPSTAPDHDDELGGPPAPSEAPRPATWSKRQSSPYA